MAAPGVTSRTTPTGYKLPEGFRAFVAYSLRNAVDVWEVEVSPAGMEAAEIDTSTQHSTKWRTKWISALVNSTDVPFTAGYNPDAMDDLMFLCGAQSGSFTVQMPQNTKYSYWGGMKTLGFQPLKAGQFPLVNITNCVTNWDTANRVEAGPAVTQAAGT